MMRYHSDRDAGWSSQVARRAHNPEVAGSNPAPAMTKPPVIGGLVVLRRVFGRRFLPDFLRLRPREQPRLRELGRVRVGRSRGMHLPLRRGARALRVARLRLHEHPRHACRGRSGQGGMAHSVPRPGRERDPGLRQCRPQDAGSGQRPRGAPATERLSSLVASRALGPCLAVVDLGCVVKRNISRVVKLKSPRASRTDTRLRPTLIPFAARNGR